MGPQALNDLCGRLRIAELRTRTAPSAGLRGRCRSPLLGGHPKGELFRLAVVPNQLHVTAPVDEGFEQVLSLVAADATRQGIDDLLPGQGSSRLPGHLRDETEHRDIVDDLSDHLLSFPHARVENLPAEIRNVDVALMHGHET